MIRLVVDLGDLGKQEVVIGRLEDIITGTYGEDLELAQHFYEELREEDRELFHQKFNLQEEGA